MSKTKRYLSFGITTGSLAIAFAILYAFNVIKTLDLFLCVTYVLYFVGIALFYNGSYAREKNHMKTSHISNICAVIVIVASLGFLIYGFVNGNIAIFNF